MTSIPRNAREVNGKVIGPCGEEKFQWLIVGLVGNGNSSEW